MTNKYFITNSYQNSHKHTKLIDTFCIQILVSISLLKGKVRVGLTCNLCKFIFVVSKVLEGWSLEVGLMTSSSQDLGSLYY